MSTSVFQRPRAASALLAGREYKIPVDPGPFIREMGFSYRLEPTLESIGEDSYLDIPTKAVLVNAKASSAVRRFAAAEELGRLISRNADENPDQSTVGQILYAKAFAAELLMPEGLVAQGWKEGVSSEELCRQMDVPVTALEFRLRQIGLL